MTPKGYEDLFLSKVNKIRNSKGDDGEKAPFWDRFKEMVDAIGSVEVLSFSQDTKKMLLEFMLLNPEFSDAKDFRSRVKLLNNSGNSENDNLGGVLGSVKNRLARMLRSFSEEFQVETLNKTIALFSKEVFAKELEDYADVPTWFLFFNHLNSSELLSESDVWQVFMEELDKQQAYFSIDASALSLVLLEHLGSGEELISNIRILPESMRRKFLESILDLDSNKPNPFVKLSPVTREQLFKMFLEWDLVFFQANDDRFNKLAQIVFSTQMSYEYSGSYIARQRARICPDSVIRTQFDIKTNLNDFPFNSDFDSGGLKAVLGKFGENYINLLPAFKMDMLWDRLGSSQVVMQLLNQLASRFDFEMPFANSLEAVCVLTGIEECHRQLIEENESDWQQLFVSLLQLQAYFDSPIFEGIRIEEEVFAKKAGRSLFVDFLQSVEQALKLDDMQIESDYLEGKTFSSLLHQVDSNFSGEI